MSCGNNAALEESKGLKDSMKDLMEQGSSALGDLESKMGELTAKLGEFKPEIPENATLQDFVNKLGEATDGTAFAETYAEMKQKFGEAWEEMDTQLEEMGLGKFPPSLDATTSFLKKETGIDMDALASGDFSSLEAYHEKMCAPVWDDNLGEYVTPDGCTPGGLPDISGILSGDFSSLGDVGAKISSFQDDPQGAICSVVPKLEEVEVDEEKENPETGVVEIVKVKKAFEFPDFSKIATEVPAVEAGSVQSSINEYIKAAQTYTAAKKQYVLGAADDFNNKVIPHLESIGEWPDLEQVSPRVYKEEKSRIEREWKYSIDYVSRPLKAAAIGKTYEEYMEAGKFSQGFSAIKLEEFVKKYLDATGTGGSYYYDSLVANYDKLNETTLDFPTMFKNYFFNKYENDPLGNNF